MFRLVIDVDERDDIAEVLLHGNGAAADWLIDAGVKLEFREVWVGVTR